LTFLPLLRFVIYLFHDGC